ncbi:LOW QUALITY PROTEIN: hypothetical protein HID58_067479 [Brassica napus]|uniref:Uncharacterized protein n=1 Tax=Brassica napus TaxID=3708 RepID=A0ABQ7ZIN8_BRANA|nr:LOW QUALITY PROTEIN: hypothetical protein HID58_067479 [Brassica napus]
MAEWRRVEVPPSSSKQGPPVREILKKDRKRLPAFEGILTEKLAYMHLSGFSNQEGYLDTGILTISCLFDADLPRVDYSSGKDTIEQVLKFPLERHQIPFLQSIIIALQYLGINGFFRFFSGSARQGKNPKAIVAKRASPAGGRRYPPIDPPSVIEAEEVAVWRKKYKLPDDVYLIQKTGFLILVWMRFLSTRDQFPSLVAKISETLGISPGQLNPPAWRTLIALQNLVFLLRLSSKWRRVEVPPSSSKQGPPVREILKKDKKRLPAYEGNWTDKFAFMHLSGFSSIWRLEDLPRVDYSSGEDTIEQVLKLPLERRQIPFLVSKASLKRCSIWEKRQAVAAAAPSSSKNKSKASGSSPKGSPSASYDWATVLTNLNKKVFPSTPVLLASEEDSSMAIQSLQGDLLQVASQLYHLGERMESAASTKVEMDTLVSQLHEAKDKDIKALMLKVTNQEEAGELVAAENVSLREEELNDLKDAAETFEAEKAMAVNGAKVLARRELLRDWDPVNTLEKYKTVETTEAELLGVPGPSFEYETQVPGDEEVKKMPEPAADDPPAN